jgi:tetratricopeptide (TPR) repeat protein
MLAGAPPHAVEGLPLPEAARIVCEEPPGPLGIDTDLKTIVFKALDKDPARRYGSVAALADDVDRYLRDQPILARPPSVTYQLRKMISRHRIGFGFIVALVLLLAGLAVTMVVTSARVAAERDRAESEAAKARAINRFLLETLGSANPMEGSGRDVTVLEALGHATEKIGASFAEQPAVEAKVRYTIGNTYLRLGRYDEAERLFREAVGAWERARGPDHPDLAGPLTSLALVKHERGDFDQAEAMYRRALAMKRKAHGDDHPDVVGIQSNLALLLQEKGDLDAAEPLFRRILASDRRTQGPEHLHVGIDLNNLGRLLTLRGKLDESERLLREAVVIFRKHGHPGLAICLGNLGQVFLERDDPEGAEPILAEALKLARAKFGEKSQDAAKIVSKFGTCLLKLGRHEEAERRLLAALEVLASSAGEKNDWTQRTLESLAELYEALGDEPAAAEHRARLIPAGEEADTGSL